MDRVILLLEDDSERLRRFEAVLREIAPSRQIVVWRDAHCMIRECVDLLPKAALISLDHDLKPVASTDPGDGLMVAEFLCSQNTIRPVIVHSSNAERAARMMGTFELAIWPCWRVPAIGEDWIESDWRFVACCATTPRKFQFYEFVRIVADSKGRSADLVGLDGIVLGMSEPYQTGEREYGVFFDDRRRMHTFPECDLSSLGCTGSRQDVIPPSRRGI